VAILMAFYPQPQDPEKFDAYYWKTHVPLAKKMPGLKKFEVSKGTVQSADGKTPYYLVALLEWDSMEALQASLASKEGQEAAADVANFAPEGTTVLIFDTKPA